MPGSTCCTSKPHSLGLKDLVHPKIISVINYSPSCHFNLWDLRSSP